MRKVFRYLIGSIALAVVAYLLVALLYDTPEEAALERENQTLSAELGRIEKRTELLENVVEGLSEKDASLYYDIFNTAPPSYLTSYVDSSRFTIAALSTLSEPELVWLSHSTVSRMEATAERTSSQLGEILDALSAKGSNPTGIPSIIPIRNFSITGTGASVGQKFNPFFKTIRPHDGVDLMAPGGTPVVAAADGRVTSVERKEKGFGNRVEITHPNGIKTAYAHLQEVRVSQGQSVRKGSVIGLVGSSGRAFAPHLHYEVILGGKKVEPVHYFFSDLNEMTYRDMLMLAMTTGQSMD
ncbi:MAG: M23 family metallopeptidase [Bacteroidales bacterium]|nr:M23 family metallopeptidase [Bacteroidales bacterium]